MSDAVAGAGAILVLSDGVAGDCANATVANNAEPARPAMVYLANIRVLLSLKSVPRKPATRTTVPPIFKGNTEFSQASARFPRRTGSGFTRKSSEAAPIGRH